MPDALIGVVEEADDRRLLGCRRPTNPDAADRIGVEI
jgi:hypothetical protein